MARHEEKQAPQRLGPVPGGHKDFAIVDLSMVTNDDPGPHPGGAYYPAKVTNISHREGALVHAQAPWFVDPTDWPWPGESAAEDIVEMSTHIGTHMDAPFHYGPWTIPDKRRPKTIEEVPLEWCMGDGVVLDIRDVPYAHVVTVQEVKDRLDAVGYELKAGDIVLVMTGNDRHWGTPEYVDRGGFLGRDSLRWILEHGIKLVGTDAWSFDRAAKQWGDDYRKHGRDSSYIWPCHLLGLEIEYSHLEKLTNLDLLPPYGFTVVAFPIKIYHGSAGFVRAVALVPHSKA